MNTPTDNPAQFPAPAAVDSPTAAPQPAPPTAIDLDIVMTKEQCAAWLCIAPKTLAKRARDGIIPCLRIGYKTIRFHPRTVLAKLNKL